MRPRRVLLVEPGELFRRGRGRSPIRAPLRPGQLALYSHLREHRVDEVSCLDLDLEPLPAPRSADDELALAARCAELLAGAAYDVAAISCFSTYSYPSAVLVARASKKVHPAATVVVGGWHCLSEAHDFTDLGGIFDVVVRGPGERPLLAVARGELRPTDGTLVVDAPAFTRAEHAGLDYRLVDHVRQACARYAADFRAANAVMLPVSRGCPHACHFCGNSLSPDRRWLALPVSSCLSLVEQARAVFPNLEACYFGDAVFGASRRWRRELLQALARDFPGLPFVVITRAELLEHRDVELLAACSAFVVLGVESLSPATLTAMRKTPDPTRYIARTGQVVRELRSNGVPHELYLIVDHPGESEESIRTTLAELDGLMGPLTTTMGFRYLHLPQFARAYDELRQRFGTELRGPVRWWQEPGMHDTDTLTRQYVPSKRQGESFDQAKERLETALVPLDGLLRRHARMVPHGTVARHLADVASASGSTAV